MAFSGGVAQTRNPPAVTSTHAPPGQSASTRQSPCAGLPASPELLLDVAPPAPPAPDELLALLDEAPLDDEDEPLDEEVRPPPAPPPLLALEVPVLVVPAPPVPIDGSPQAAAPAIAVMKKPSTKDRIPFSTPQSRAAINPEGDRAPPDASRAPIVGAAPRSLR